MNKRILPLFAISALAAFAQNPTVTSVSYSDLSHSTLLVHMQISSGWQNVRIRYIPTAQGSCLSGTGGSVQPSGYPGYGGSTFRPLTFQIILSGLAPDTQYQVCPEVANIGTSYDGSGPWSSGAGFVVRTLPQPAVHPAIPVPALEFKPVLPDMTNYHVVTLDNACYVASGGPVGQFLGDAIGDAANHQAEYGTRIIAPHTANCTQLSQLSQMNTDSQNVTTFSDSQVSMTDSSITFSPGQISQMMGGGQINEGQQLRFSTNYGQLPGGSYGRWPSFETPTKCTGIINGYIYFAHLPNPADHTKIQLTCNAPYGQNQTDGLPYKLMTFAFQGNGNLKVQRYPTGLNWIVLDTDVPDTQFAPINTRVSPAWASKMPTMTHIYKGMGTPNGNGNVPGSGGVVPIQFNTASNDGNEQRTISNLWVRRWKFTVADDLDSDTSTDPLWYRSQIATSGTSSDVVFDQVLIQGLGAPHRTWRPIDNFNGHNMALINSYVSDLDMFQSDFRGLNLQQLSSTSFKIGAGTHGLNGLHLYTQPSDLTVTMNTGTKSGSIMVSAALDGSTVNVSLPPGVTGTCTGGPATSSLRLTGPPVWVMVYTMTAAAVFTPTLWAEQVCIGLIRCLTPPTQP